MINKSNYQKWCETFMTMREGTRDYIGLFLHGIPVMMGKLLKYDHKKHWIDSSVYREQNVEELKNLLTVEVFELIDAIENGTIDEINDEAGDVANIALMIIHCNIERSKK